MKKTHLIGGGITLLAAAMFTGCNSNSNNGTGSGSSTTTVTVTPSLGKILNAKVILRNARTGAKLGESTTGTTGVAKVGITSTTEPIKVDVELPVGTHYFDESKGTDTVVAVNQTLHALVPDSTKTSVGVTTLTELAFKAAVAGGINNATSAADAAKIIKDANQQIGDSLGKSLGQTVPDILTPPTLIGDTNLDATITAQNVANNYALLLSALAKLGTGTNPALDAIEKLAQDMNDGVFDQKSGATNVAYDLAAAGNLQAAIEAFFKAVAQISPALKALYPDADLHKFKPDFSKPIPLVHLGAGGFGSLLATPIPTGMPINHIATTVNVTENGNIVTAKWTENGVSSFTAMFDKTSGVVQSVKVQDSGSSDFLQCLTATCSGLTVNLTTKTLTAVNLNVASNAVPNTAILAFNGVLRFGAPINGGGFPAGTSEPLTAASSATQSDFFTAIAGSYKLFVSDVGAEGVSTGAELEFPLNSLHDVTISATGDVTIQGATKLLTYSHTIANGYSNNHIAYFANNTVAVDITYNPATGELKLGPQGFTASGEGGATLKSKSHAPVTPPIGTADCGSSAVLTLADLAPFAKSYTVKVFKGGANPGDLITVKSNVGLLVAASGDIMLDGIPAKVQVVCDNDFNNNGVIIQGIIVYLDKVTGSFTDPQGNVHQTHASIDFFANGDTTGEDFNNTSGDYQFFNNTN